MYSHHFSHRVFTSSPNWRKSAVQLLPIIKYIHTLSIYKKSTHILILLIEKTHRWPQLSYWAQCVNSFELSHETFRGSFSSNNVHVVLGLSVSCLLQAPLVWLVAFWKTSIFTCTVLGTEPFRRPGTWSRGYRWFATKDEKGSGNHENTLSTLVFSKVMISG